MFANEPHLSQTQSLQDQPAPGFVHDARPTGWIVPSSMRNKQHALLFPGEVAPDRDFWQESIFR